jgi:hypothetical protein
MCFTTALAAVLLTASSRSTAMATKNDKATRLNTIVQARAAPLAKTTSTADTITSYSCDGSGDTCRYTFNGVCDANGLICAAVNSDCFDCDPCQAYRFQGCEACTSAPEGCQWCGADASCKSPGVTIPETMMTCAQSDFVASCPASTTAFFSDPLYDGMVWLYDLVKVRPVWEAGYSKSFAECEVDGLVHISMSKLPICSWDRHWNPCQR